MAEPVPDFEVMNPDGDAYAAIPLQRKLFVDTGKFPVLAEAWQVPDSSTGRLRLTEYGEYVQGAVKAIAGSAGDLTERWAHSPSREEMVAELAAKGIALPELVAEDALDVCDPLDVLLQLAWNVPAQTRAERARRARSAHAGEMAELSARAQAVLAALLDRYAVHGIDDITSGEVLTVEPLRGLGSPVAIAQEFGGPDGWHDQVDRIQRWLYSA